MKNPLKLAEPLADNMLRGAFPPVDFLAVCLVLAIGFSLIDHSTMRNFKEKRWQLLGSPGSLIARFATRRTGAVTHAAAHTLRTHTACVMPDPWRYMLARRPTSHPEQVIQAASPSANRLG